MSISRKLLRIFVCCAVGPGPAAAAPLAVRVERTGGVTLGSRTIYSSTALEVTWTDGDAGTHHFEIVATDGAIPPIAEAARLLNP